MLPLNEIHFELWKLESFRWTRTIDMGEPARTEQPRRLRLRLGRALIAGGRAIAGELPAERPVVRHNRPVSAHR